jgi:hypothetical protein
MEHFAYGSTDTSNDDRFVIDDAELYEEGVSLEIKKYIYNTDKNETSFDRKDSWAMRLIQLVVITLIAAGTRIIVFFTLEI